MFYDITLTSTIQLVEELLGIWTFWHLFRALGASGSLELVKALHGPLTEVSSLPQRA